MRAAQNTSAGHGLLTPSLTGLFEWNHIPERMYVMKGLHNIWDLRRHTSGDHRRQEYGVILLVLFHSGHMQRTLMFKYSMDKFDKNANHGQFVILSPFSVIDTKRIWSKAVYGTRL